MTATHWGICFFLPSLEEANQDKASGSTTAMGISLRVCVFDGLRELVHVEPLFLFCPLFSLLIGKAKQSNQILIAWSGVGTKKEANESSWVRVFCAEQNLPSSSSTCSSPHTPTPSVHPFLEETDGKQVDNNRLTLCVMI